MNLIRLPIITWVHCRCLKFLAGHKSTTEAAMPALDSCVYFRNVFQAPYGVLKPHVWGTQIQKKLPNNVLFTERDKLNTR